MPKIERSHEILFYILGHTQMYVVGNSVSTAL